MEQNNKKLIFKIALAILTVCFFAVGLVSNLVAGKLPSRYFTYGGLDMDKAWVSNVYELTAPEYDTDEGDTFVYDSVWISFASIDYTEGVEEIAFRASRATGKDRTFTSDTKSKVTFKNDAQSLNIGGWVQLYDYADDISNASYFVIATRNQIKVNEVAFVGKLNGKLVQLSATGIGSGFAGTGESDWSKKFTESWIDKDENAIKEANKLVNEQKTFDVSLIDGDVYNGGEKILFDSEVSLLLNVNGINDGFGSVDYTLSPLGVYTIALGRTIFGGNPFGLRIMPLLFSVGCLLMLFAIGKKLFNEESYAFILSLLYAFSGYSLAYATVSNAGPIMAFFILCAFYFALAFWKKKPENKNDRKPFINLLLAGLFTACASVVKAQALLFVPAIIVPIIFALINLSKSEVGKETAGFAAAVALISFILMPVVLLIGTYGLGAGLYMTEEATSVFDYGFSHYVQSLKTGFGSSAGYIVNLGIESFSNKKIVMGNLVLTYLAIPSVIYLGYVVVTMLTKDKSKKFALPLVYAFACVGYIGSYLLSLLFAGNPSAFALTLIFGIMLIVMAYRHLDKTYKTALFNVNGMAVSIVRIIGAILLVATIVAFGISLPVYLGI